MGDMPLKRMLPNAADKALRDDILALAQRHLTPDTPERFLAIAAQVVGQVIALQDQRTMTKEMIWQIVGANIELGNQGVLDQINETKGRA